VSGDDKGWLDRDKKSFAELDRQRREGGGAGGGAREPRSEAERERSAAATKQYMKEVDGVFSGGDRAEREKLATAMRDAHGTPGLADACRAYLAAGGPPSELPLISLFLDSGEPELILHGYDALRAGGEQGAVTLSGSLRSQLRILAEDPDDAVAEGAEELLEAL
jgi:hypothetical protein